MCRGSVFRGRRGWGRALSRAISRLPPLTTTGPMAPLVGPASGLLLRSFPSPLGWVPWSLASRGRPYGEAVSQGVSGFPHPCLIQQKAGSPRLFCFSTKLAHNQIGSLFLFHFSTKEFTRDFCLGRIIPCSHLLIGCLRLALERHLLPKGD